jgi:hypothetical protein
MYGDWPTEETTVVDPGPRAEPAPRFAPPPGEPLPPPGRGPDDGIGWGFLIGIVLALIVGGIVAAILLARHNNQAATTAVTTTVVVSTGVGATTPPAPTTAATAPTTTAATPPPTTTAKVTTTATTAAAPTTTASSIPPWPTAVPDVGSSRVQGAVDKLRSSGLLVTLAYVPNDLPLGTVVAQSPSAGVSAPAESHVTLNLSEGKGGSASKGVPSVTGRTIPEAVAAVKGAGLRLIFVRAPVSDRSQAGTVVAQTPAPGAQIPAHAEVLVYMGAAR